MPTVIWILVWVAVIATVAFFMVREVLSGRRERRDVDRLHHHQAVREAELNRDQRSSMTDIGLWQI